jgi:hypothetical protein
LAVVDWLGAHTLSSAVVEESYSVVTTDWVDDTATDTGDSERNSHIKTVLGVLDEGQEVDHEGAGAGDGITPSFVGQGLSCLCQLAHVLVRHIV